MPVTQLIASIADLDSQLATTSVYVDGLVSDPSAGLGASYIAALQATCGGAVYNLTGHVQDNVAVGVSAANDYGAEDKCTVYGRSASGQDVEMGIPSPLESLFNADGETVNFGAGAGATLKTALETYWVGPDGSAVTVLSAQRTRPTRRR